MTWKKCRTRSTYLFCVGLVLAVGPWITFHFWKCPNCGRRRPLHATAETITRCPSCAFALKQTQ